MFNFKSLTDDELNNLRDKVSETLTSVKRSTTKRKLKIITKTAVSVLVVIGGTTATVLFPSPISVAILSVAVGYIGGNSGVRKDVRKTRAESAKRKVGKKELRELDNEVNNRRTKKELIEFLKEQGAEPTAPQLNRLYPDLPTQ